MRPDWVDEEIKDSRFPLTAQQVHRLFDMCNKLRDPICMEMVLEIKKAVENKDAMAVVGLWEGLSEEEQIALYVAPKYGGIFTTEERKAIKTGVIE